MNSFTLASLIICQSLIFPLTFVTAGIQTHPDFNSILIADNIPTPRGLLVDDKGDILVLSRGSSSIIALYPGGQKYSQSLIVNGTGLQLNHGIAYKSGFLYASSGEAVYRWPYSPGQRRVITAQEEIVISNISIPNPGKQNTRTIIFDENGLLYVTINSDMMIDQQSSWRCRIRRFNISQIDTNGGIEFESGELFADGVRNEVGLAFDSNNVLWGVENAGGIDYLIRDDLGGNIHDGNPADELNRFDNPPGTHYGYPHCFSSYILKDFLMGTQFAWPMAISDGNYSDEWCRQKRNNHPPSLPLPPHTAPLGLEFYKHCSSNSSVEGAFPCSFLGNGVIAFHGSMNITTPVGYNVAMYIFNDDGNPTGESLNILSDSEKGSGANPFRPVSAVFDKEGHLIVSDDSGGQIVRVGYTGEGGNNSKGNSVMLNVLICIFCILFCSL